MSNKLLKIGVNILAAIVLFIIFSVFPVTASAHVLKYDGSIGAVLHVNPDDDPIVGKETNFFFEFKDKNSKFNPADCDCVVTIYAEGKEIYSTDLFASNAKPDLSNASFSFVFPAKNIYKIVVIGEPKNSDSFQKFTLSYDVRVSRSDDVNVFGNTKNSNWFSTHKIHIILYTIGFLMAVFLLAKFSKKKK